MSHRPAGGSSARGLVGGTPGSHQFFGGLVELPCRRAKELASDRRPGRTAGCFVDDPLNPRVTQPVAGGEEPGIGRQHTANTR